MSFWRYLLVWIFLLALDHLKNSIQRYRSYKWVIPCQINQTLTSTKKTSVSKKIIIGSFILRSTFASSFNQISRVGSQTLNFSDWVGGLIRFYHIFYLNTVHSYTNYYYKIQYWRSHTRDFIQRLRKYRRINDPIMIFLGGVFFILGQSLQKIQYNFFVFGDFL